MTVRKLIEELEKFDDDMEVCDCTFCEVEEVVERTWVHSNYPYDKPDKQIVVIM